MPNPLVKNGLDTKIYENFKKAADGAIIELDVDQRAAVFRKVEKDEMDSVFMEAGGFINQLCIDENSIREAAAMVTWLSIMALCQKAEFTVQSLALYGGFTDG